MQCDVLVIGGGSAGLAAGVAASRAGASTILVERNGSMGGMATASLVHSVCGLYLVREEPDAVYANKGFAPEFAERLIAAGGASGPLRMGRVDVLMHAPPIFACVADAIASEAANLELRLFSEVTDVRARDGRIDSVKICSRGIHETIEPQVVVDASGDAAGAFLSGASWEQESSEHLQRPAYIFALQSVDTFVLEGNGRLALAKRVVQGVQNGSLSTVALGTTFRTNGQPGLVFATIDLQGNHEQGAYDPLDARCLTELERLGRKTAMEVAGYLKSEAPGFENAFIGAFPTRAGVRESRRIIGRYQIQDEDILEGAEFDDAVAVASWPMEFHEKATGVKLRFPKDNRSCGIPLRALQSIDMENLLVAGRAIASTHNAQASLRVIGTCLATGEAAGIAAALSIHGEVDAARVCQLRDTFSRP